MEAAEVGRVVTSHGSLEGGGGWRHAGTRVLAAEVRGTLVAGPVCAAAAAARTALSSPPGSSGGARHLSCAATGAGPGPGHGDQCSTFTWTQEREEEASYFLWTHTHTDNMFSGITEHTRP